VTLVNTIDDDCRKVFFVHFFLNQTPDDFIIWLQVARVTGLEEE
jgi:hypothetical protein